MTKIPTTPELTDRRLKAIIDDLISDRTTTPLEIIDAFNEAIIYVASSNPHTATMHLELAAAALTAAAKTIKDRNTEKHLH